MSCQVSIHLTKDKDNIFFLHFISYRKSMRDKCIIDRAFRARFRRDNRADCFLFRSTMGMEQVEHMEQDWPTIFKAYPQ